ncbi:MAG: cytochrome C oxidase subunit IV family protein [Bacteroidota bacterium]|nr:cytochrome C oxidase subunit IV family protein [Bacteroidota bacterium]MDP4249855.1 cytochrome C oxidase subunit IV family protein [Bacteroidota bacterium]
MDSATAVQHTQHSDKHSFDTRIIWRTFWVLTAITVFELFIAILYYETDFLPKHILNGVFIIMTLAKAFFIIAEFMHLRHEIKNMIMVLAVPALLFIWFVIAFMGDGVSYRHLRNRYDRYQYEQSKTPVKKAEKPEAKKPGVE